MKFTIAVGALAAASCASAFVLPARTSFNGVATVQRQATCVFGNGKYDGQEWNDDAKKDVLSTYDASAPWSETNFDPYKKVRLGEEWVVRAGVCICTSTRGCCWCLFVTGIFDFSTPARMFAAVRTVSA